MGEYSYFRIIIANILFRKASREFVTYVLCLIWKGDVPMSESMDNIIFKNAAHRGFFKRYLPKCRYQDVYHVALIYCLGISEDTRRNADRIYDFKSGYVKTECMHEGWQTSGSQHIIRLAYNLYCNGTPSVSDCEDLDDQLSECSRYTVEDVFCCGYAPYFWQAVKLRYPEYCGCA